MKKSYPFLCLSSLAAPVLLAPVDSTSAAVLVRYEFATVTNPGTDGFSASTDLDTDSVASDIVAGSAQMLSSTLGNPAPSGAYGGTGGSGTPTTNSFAITNNRYWEFTITPKAGWNFEELASITFQYQRNATESATHLFLMSSIDGYASTAQILHTTGAAPAPSTTVWTPVSWTLSSAFEDLPTNQAVTFRLYAYGSQNNNTGSTLRVDNLILNGTVVPEPSAVVMLCGAMGFFVCKRRRARVAQN